MEVVILATDVLIKESNHITNFFLCVDIPLLYISPYSSPYSFPINFLAVIVWIFAFATCMELAQVCPCALASVMNFSWTQGKVTLLVLKVFRVEAFTISSPCHRLNYLNTSLIHTCAASTRSDCPCCRLHTFSKNGSKM